MNNVKRRGGGHNDGDTFQKDLKEGKNLMTFGRGLLAL
jgi:hypothetical protein